MICSYCYKTGVSAKHDVGHWWNNPNLLGVVNHGSINNHKFRGYEWFTDSAEGTLLGLTGAY